MKEAALKHVDDPGPRPVKFQARDNLLAFLEAVLLCCVPTREKAHPHAAHQSNSA
jgi:hypothetical protein